MKSYSLTLLPDHVVVAHLKSITARDCETTAEMLAHIGEVNERGLWADEGYQSMYDFCVHGLHMSEGVALKRIQAAKAARAFPAIHAMVATGKLHLTAVCMLAPRLTPENAPGLLAAATHQTKAAIEMILASWFPRLAVPTSVQRMESMPIGPGDAPVPEHAPGHVEVSPPRARVAPLSAETFELRCTLSRSTHDKMRLAQSLLGPAVPSGDIPALLELAFEALVVASQKRKFCASTRPRASKGTPKGRHVPAQVKREVWERDGGRCTFVSGSGRRCEADTRLEYDHIEPVACGGASTTANLRLRCRAHNQLEAERRFGKGFMARKKQAARAASVPVRDEPEVTRPSVDADLTVYDPDHTTLRTRRDEIVPYLRKLGCKVEQAKRGAAMCDHLLGEPLAVRVKFAIQQLGRARFERCTVRPGPA